MVISIAVTQFQMTKYTPFRGPTTINQNNIDLIFTENYNQAFLIYSQKIEKNIST